MSEEVKPKQEPPVPHGISRIDATAALLTALGAGTLIPDFPLAPVSNGFH